MTNELHLHQISVSEMDNNCYLLTAGDQGLLVDAADNAPAILDMAREAGVDITAVLTTHRHWDHVRALGEVLEATNAKHYASFIDSPAIPENVDVELREGDSIEFAGMKLPIIILRGHTPGGVALVATVDGVTNLFVGDSVFPGGLGRTTSEGDFVRLYKDVSKRIFEEFPDNAIIRPGHGKPTTLGEERPKLGDWWERRW
ncbi:MULTISPECIES: MBL fold metallo-hydrolase [unclassified Corynebacterium]|uniref:MBL fold metallo-hydrolase n=1 Tax=Corynebacterium TaxID=1716 RepID=UPI00254A174A|nr:MULTISPECIES: MBL fold metallo-hydrolase [unclassified Corynebacterium]MDK8476522.1 MBL fold metallo-hydrolase [Corynebacterium sp. MSK310]MDK8492064.1 MBL fold metallo-hydrolase [Corynebacterium sp. MSK175]MDK8672774.1 MBL fold metallo-hydrolase [Corynebacterium sp. MSK189]MDK8736193.1 MBL fold metallo-hydrolase [Corynebacterium sp. MSK306]